MLTVPPRALVVDDEAIIAFTIEDLLRLRGYDVTVASTREQLEDALSGPAFSLAVTDTDFADHREISLWGADVVVICSGSPVSDLADLFPGRPVLGKPFDDSQVETLLSSLDR